MPNTRTITLQFLGGDDWERAVFFGDNGHFYKTTELLPDSMGSGGFQALTEKEKDMLLNSLYTTDEFDGEPRFSVSRDRFELAG